MGRHDIEIPFANAADYSWTIVKVRVTLLFMKKIRGSSSEPKLFNLPFRYYIAQFKESYPRLEVYFELSDARPPNQLYAGEQPSRRLVLPSWPLNLPLESAKL